MRCRGTFKKAPLRLSHIFITNFYSGVAGLASRSAVAQRQVRSGDMSALSRKIPSGVERFMLALALGANGGSTTIDYKRKLHLPWACARRIVAGKVAHLTLVVLEIFHLFCFA